MSSYGQYNDFLTWGVPVGYRTFWSIYLTKTLITIASYRFLWPIPWLFYMRGSRAGAARGVGKVPDCQSLESSGRPKLGRGRQYKATAATALFGKCTKYNRGPTSMWWRGSFLWSWIAVLGLQPIAPKVHCSYWDAARIHVIGVGHIVPKHVLYIYNTTLQRRSGLLLPSSYAVGYQYIIREHGNMCTMFVNIVETVSSLKFSWLIYNGAILMSTPFLWVIYWFQMWCRGIKYVHVIGMSHVVSMHTRS